jgi:hypothetical protein
MSHETTLPNGWRAWGTNGAIGERGDRVTYDDREDEISIEIRGSDGEYCASFPAELFSVVKARAIGGAE